MFTFSISREVRMFEVNDQDSDVVSAAGHRLVPSRRTLVSDGLRGRTRLVLAGFVAVWLVFLVFAAMVKAAPFQIYTLFPTGTNSFDFWNGTRAPASYSACDALP